MQVRHFATSYAGSILLAGPWERTVATWDLNSAKCVASFDTVLDPGGRRLAVSSAGSTCVTAAYTRHGVAGYDTTTGDVVWRRLDLKQTQFVGFAAGDEAVHCAADTRPCHVLDPKDGRTVDTLRGVRRVWQSPSGTHAVLDRPKLEVVDAGGRTLAKVARVTFAVLDVAFGPDTLCVSESGGPVRCFNYAGGELWRIEPRPDSHVLRLSYALELGIYSGVLWPYVKGGAKQLVRLEPGMAAATTVCLLGNATEAAFVRRGSALVTSGGSMFEVATGRKVRHLALDELPAAGA